MAISVEQAIDLILKYTPVLGEERVPLLEAVGRVLSRDVNSEICQPPFDRSPLDGYAVIAEDLKDAAPAHPVRLQVVDKIYAGETAHVSVQRGQAVRLMTGSMIPQGADCVIRQEDTDGGEESVHIFKCVKANSNYCHQGEEYGLGDRLFTAGSLVDAACVAVAAGAGMTHLYVHKKMRAAIVSTGDEVRQPGEQLLLGKIYDSNTSYLAARLHQLDVRITAMRSAGDDLEQIVSILNACERQADLILTTGGVSVGQKDLMELAIRKSGGHIIFHGVAMKPGMPTLFAVKEKTLILGLSGNPFAAAVPFELFLRPILSRMTSNPMLEPKGAVAQTGNDFPKCSTTRRFIRAYCQNGIVDMPREQSNGQMRSMIGCNCLIDVPAGTGTLHRGDSVNIIWL